MQRIERYGVIALVFLLVTILAVAVWGQRKNQSLLSFLKRDKPAPLAQLDPQAPAGQPGELPLADPQHVPAPAGAQAPAPGAPTDPNLVIQAPAGPGSSAVNFGAPVFGAGAPGTNGVATLNPQAPIAPGGSGFVSGPVTIDTGVGAPAPISTPSTERTYKVKSGDTLGSIAKRELGSTKRWTEIASLNNVQPERLKPGMTLKLPAGASAAVESAPDVLVQRDAPKISAPKSPAPKGGSTYNVRPGDSLSRIAARQLGDANRYAEILALNPGLDPARIHPGQSLRMPADAKAATTSTSKPKPRPAASEPEVARAEPKSSKPRVQ